MEYAEADNMEKYRKYIQKRRLTPDPTAQDHDEIKEVEAVPFELPKTESAKRYPTFTESNFLKSSSERETPSYRTSESFVSPYINSSSAERSYTGRPASNLRRTDPSLYKTLYSNRKGQSHTSSYASAYASSHGTGRTDVEDNHATVLAIKLIKQSLACFAILGIIVLLQGRSDMSEVLATIKKQVLDINIEPQGIYEGIQGFIAQATQFLGGSP